MAFMNKRTLISVSISCNDRSRLKELANEQETTVSGLISQWIKKAYKKKTKECMEVKLYE